MTQSHGKASQFPLQDELWKNWWWQNKEHHQLRQLPEGRSISQYKAHLKKGMNRIRVQQQSVAYNCFVNKTAVISLIKLLILYEHDLEYTVTFVSSLLDKYSSNALNALYKRYSLVWENTDRAEGVAELESIEISILHDLVGFEHLIRDIGQIYEVGGQVP